MNVSYQSRLSLCRAQVYNAYEKVMMQNSHQLLPYRAQQTFNVAVTKQTQKYFIIKWRVFHSQLDSPNLLGWKSTLQVQVYEEFQKSALSINKWLCYRKCTTFTENNKNSKSKFTNMIVISLTCWDLANRTPCMTVIAVFEMYLFLHYKLILPACFL